MNLPAYLFLPLVAAVIYALSTLFTKRALSEGATVRQALHAANLIVGLVTLPLFWMDSGPIVWEKVHLPLLMGIMFYAGNWFTTMAIRRGDVSLVTPLMGTKVVFVAVGSILFLQDELPRVLIFAAILTAAGILVMGIPDFAKSGGHFWITLAFALASAASFGMTDVMVQAWASQFGQLAFIGLASATVAVISLLSILGSFPAKRPFRWPTKPYGIWLWIGALLIGLQAILVGISLAKYQDATGVNVVYASRGLWAIALVGLIGSRFGNREREDAGKLYFWRIVGTCMLTTAIVMAVIARSSN